MKIISNLIDETLSFLKNLDEVDLRNYIMLFFVFLFTILLSTSYYIYSSSSSLVKKIYRFDAQLVEVEKLKDLSSEVQKKEDAEKLFLSNNKLSMPLKGFIESKISELKLSPESNWKETSKVTQWLLDSDYEEEKITLVFKKISTEQLAGLLQVLYSQPAVSIRELSVTKMTDALAANISITYRQKKT